jgi:cytochrome c oxidase assembly protein subunit 19
MSQKHLVLSNPNKKNSYFLAIMASNVFGAKMFKGSPPEKGTFPLDHDGECKAPYLRYMVCLSDNKNSASICRQETKDYLDCRMQRGLMLKDDWKNLGFKDEASHASDSKSSVEA